MDMPTKEYVLAAALKISPDERLWLVERLVSSVRHELSEPEPELPRSEDHVDTRSIPIQTGEWESANVEEPFEWLQQLGKKKTDILNPK